MESCLPTNDLAKPFALLTHHHRHTRLDDSRFLVADLLQRRAQVLLMIHIDGGDDGDKRCDDVRRIEATAHTGFQHRDIHRPLGEREEGHDRRHLEERRLGLGDEGLDALIQRTNLLVRDTRSVESDALMETMDVRGRVQTHLHPLFLEDGRKGCTHRSLAVRAGHVHISHAKVRISHLVEKAKGPLQAGLDPEAMHAEQALQYVFCRHVISLSDKRIKGPVRHGAWKLNVRRSFMKRNPKRVLLGMSGGVDSSVAAALLVEEGYEVIGITMKTYRYEDVGGNVGNDSSCCSLDGINDARRVAMQLGIPHYVVDFSGTFREHVIDPFINEYMSGRTPNPCVQCNIHIKWAEMLRKADSLGAEFIATGHYAHIRFDDSRGRYMLSRGGDTRKDQSYALWGLPQEALSRTLFPLSRYSKEQSRQVAERVGLTVAKKKESYEICFIPDNDYNRFLRDNVRDLDASVRGGDVVLDDTVIAKHDGYPFYTVGQRRGLGIAHEEPLFVLNVLSDTNTLVVGTEEKLLHAHLRAKEVNLIGRGDLSVPEELTVKIRYKDEGARAVCSLDERGELTVDFLEPRRAITPGQSLVMYDGDDVIGGGIISERW